MVDTAWPLPPTPPAAPHDRDVDDAPAAPPGAGGSASGTSARPPATPVRRGRAGTALALIALAVTTSTAGGFVGHRLATGEAAPAGVPSAPPAAPAASGTTSGGLDVAAVLRVVEGAVADIQARGARSSGQGSGVVFSADGLVLTNAHVVEGATEVTVSVPGDRQPRAATVVGADVARDVAVLRLRDLDGLAVAQLGSSRDVRVGQDVVAIGNALGLRGDPSVTRGIVSALDRSIGSLSGLLQTDAAINSGNSGGPLVNAAGQVIGINTAVAVQSNAQNIGFAIPIDDARAIAERIVSGNAATVAGFLGVSSADATTATTGATVMEVTAGGPAADAGLVPGDVIVAVDGTAVSGASALGRLIGTRAPGDDVTITILRGGEERELRVALGRR